MDNVVPRSAVNLLAASLNRTGAVRVLAMSYTDQQLSCRLRVLNETTWYVLVRAMLLLEIRQPDDLSLFVGTKCALKDGNLSYSWQLTAFSKNVDWLGKELAKTINGKTAELGVGLQVRGMALPPGGDLTPDETGRGARSTSVNKEFVSPAQRGKP